MLTSGKFLLSIFAALALAAAAAAAEPPPGADSCSGCHSRNEKDQSKIPPIYGRNPGDIAAAMRAFRSGERPATVMDRIAKGFSDKEIQAIADWLAAQH